MSSTPRNKVLLIVVDALASRVVLPALERGELPAMQQLIDRGQLFPRSIAIFPSITPAATCALVTGAYPRESGISGAYWYDTQQDRVYYFGDDVPVIVKEGMDRYLNDFMVKLNFERLRCPTTFERVEEAGLTAGCVNYLWFKGDKEHKVNSPLLLKLWPGVKLPQTIRGPSLLCLGDFVGGERTDDQPPIRTGGGVFHRFGFDDKSSGRGMLRLARRDAWPDFTVVYFPDNDFQSHDRGPSPAVDIVRAFDDTLAKMFKEAGGIDKLLRHMTIIITGDHSQADTLDSEHDAAIDVDQLLEPFNPVPAGEQWSDGEQLMACVNMRAVQIYFRQDSWRRRDEVIDRLLKDTRVDQVIWNDSDRPQHGVYRVRTAQRGELSFGYDHADAEADGPEGDQPQRRRARDEYGNRWWYQGDLTAVGAQVEDGVLSYGDYPNALERLFTAFDPRVSGSLWATARPGYEFRDTKIKGHLGGGSHAGLHMLDSLSPLIVAGPGAAINLRAAPRSVDVMPLCLHCLGLDSPRALSEGHAASLVERT